MAKLNKQKYYSTKTGESKVNCYKVNLSKFIVEASGIKEDDEIIIYAEKNKIIIEKAS